MLARALLAIAAVLAPSFASLSPAPAAARDLTIVERGATMAEATQRVLVAPFTAATGIAITQQSWEGDTNTLAATLKAAGNSWDLIQVNGDELLNGCGSGQFEKLDWSQIGGKEHFLPQAASDCGVGVTVLNLTLAWDRDKFAGTPTWADFWDVAKYPAKRGLRRDVVGNLEIALMADGVAPQDVYKVLSTNDGVDRAFRKLDQLKPYIVWWKTEAEAGKILGSGDVLMTSAPSDEIVRDVRATHRNFGIQWSDSLYDVLSWAVIKGSPNLRDATQFLYFAGTPAIQGRLVELFGLGGLAKGANEGLPPNLLGVSPTSPANLKAGLQIDATFWHDNLPKLHARFETWLGH
jgi:putative spermidine/putrescine transport system substrate-binding protein